MFFINYFHTNIAIIEISYNSFRQLAIGNRQLAIGNRQWAIGNRQWAIVILTNTIVCNFVLDVIKYS